MGFVEKQKDREQRQNGGFLFLLFLLPVSKVKVTQVVGIEEI